MMAFEKTPPRPTLDSGTLDALRRILSTSLAEGNHTDGLHDVLCQAAAEARTKGMHAEQLLVDLKELWYSLPSVSSASSAEVSNKLLRELISRCIQEYYAL
jgi:hypothetical protein